MRRYGAMTRAEGLVGIDVTRYGLMWRSAARANCSARTTMRMGSPSWLRGCAGSLRS
jgi:hypothetical protein